MSYPKQDKGQDPSYPPSQMPGYPPQYTAGPPPPATGAPPPYSTNMYAQAQAQVGMQPHNQQWTYAAAQAPPYSYPSQLPGPPMGGPPPNAYAYQAQSQMNRGYPVQPGGPVYQAHVQPTVQFDSGARFDGIASQSVPPPPPGVAPNAAQMAAAQGQQVFATQKKDNWFTGGKGGGVTFW